MSVLATPLANPSVSAAASASAPPTPSAGKPLPSPRLSRHIPPGANAPQQLQAHLRELALVYQRLLLANPRHPQALLGMSIIALASRQPQAALQLASVAVAAAPHLVLAWVTLGQAARAAARPADAEQAYQQAIRLDGTNPIARMGLGELLLLSGRAAEAIPHFELAIRRQPAMASAHLGLGSALACLGRTAQALPHYERALALRPRSPEAEFATAFALARLGRPQEAERRYRRALVLRPDFAAVWMNLGSLLRDQGREAFAEAALQRAVELRPDMITGWLNLAILERERRRPDQAEKHLRKAFALDPSQPDTLIAWCQFRSAERDQAGAWEWLRWALARDPDNSEALNMQGILLHNDRRFAEAVEVFERAEQQGSKAAASNRGNSLIELARPAEALRAQESAVERDPFSVGSAYNLALTRLRLGHWQQGWPGYESRWHFREVHRTPRAFPQPRWQGEPLAGRRILLHAEQGLGDTIQFCRYAAMVAARGGLPLLQVQQPVLRLMHSLAVVRSGQAQVSLLGSPLPGFDLECPLMSLPAAFHTTVETTPWPGAYLGADPDLVREKGAQFPTPVSQLRIGFAWAGNPRYKADHRRSTQLRTLLPLLGTPGCAWISLQKGEPAEQLATLPPNLIADLHVTDASIHDQDMAETAALIATLDLVITTDTSIAHLAGALGKPVWILLPHLADWRWMQDRPTTPWYPTARLFRQPAPGDWSSLLDRVIEELSASRRSQSTPL